MFGSLSFHALALCIEEVVLRRTHAGCFSRRSYDATYALRTSRSEMGPGCPCLKTSESTFTSVPGVENLGAPVGWVCTRGAFGGSVGTGSARFELLALSAVATPPPTRAPTAKQAAWTMDELGIEDGEDKSAEARSSSPGVFHVEVPAGSIPIYLQSVRTSRTST